MDREIDLDLLRFLTGKGSRHIEAAVEGTGYLPRTVVGVGTYLLDIDGNVDLLTAKQKTTYEKFLKPLLFDVSCQGVSSPKSCAGDGVIEADLLLKCYRDDDFRCRSCRELMAYQPVN